MGNFLGVKDFGLLKQLLEWKAMEFQGKSIKSKLDQLKLLTSDPDVLKTLSGVPISIVSAELLSLKTYQYLFNKKNKIS